MKTRISNLIRSADFELRFLVPSIIFCPKTLVLHLIVTWPWKLAFPICYKLILNSVFSFVPHLLSTDARKHYCLCLCSFAPRLLQLSPVWLSSVSLNQTTKSQKQRCSPCSKGSPNWPISPHLASLSWLPIDSRIQYKLISLCYMFVPNCSRQLWAKVTLQGRVSSSSCVSSAYLR